MVPLRLRDSLSFEPTPPTRAGRPGPIHVLVRSAFPRDRFGAAQALPPAGEQNLVAQAIELLRRESGCAQGARVELVKRIPLAAGLGGGSSDAAAALSLANSAWGLNWGRDRLSAVAAQVGSDVPFFLARGPAVCRGRGEQVEPLARSFPLHVVIVKPPAGLSTSDVYRALDPPSPVAAAGRSDRLAGLLRVLGRGTWSEIGHWMSNRLAAATAALSPWVEQAQDTFSQLDFVGHQLAGSGTAYFGVCRHAQHARRLATILKARQLGLVYVTRSC